MNRDRHLVIYSIIHLLSDRNVPMSRTMITYKTITSYDQSRLYIDDLIKKGILEESERGYKLTQKGHELHAAMQELFTLLSYNLE